MNEEAAFLTSIRADPRDDVRRLVYADWLDERGTDEARAKAEYLRLEVHLAGMEPNRPERAVFLRQVRQLAALLPLEWKGTVEQLVVVERCQAVWQSVCPKRWDRMAPSDDPTVRSCEVCRLEVHFCNSSGGARAVASVGHPVAVDLGVPRYPGDLDPFESQSAISRFVPVTVSPAYQVPVQPGLQEPGGVQASLPPGTAVTTTTEATGYRRRYGRAAPESPPAQPGLLRRLWRKLTGR